MAVSNLDDTPQITKLSPDHVTIFMISTSLPLFEFGFDNLQIYRFIQNRFLGVVKFLYSTFIVGLKTFKLLEKKKVGETVVGDIIGKNYATFCIHLESFIRNIQHLAFI